MSEVEYEYDSPSDPDEEPIGQEFFWNEINKRVFCMHGEIHIIMEENDHVSVLEVILNVIQQGIGSQYLAVKLQIEQLHNAIVTNPTKRTGLQRLETMKKLKKLLRPTLFLNNIVSIDIPNAEDYLTLYHEKMPNITNMRLHKPKNYLFNLLSQFKKIQTLEIGNIRSVPTFHKLKLLHTLRLCKIRRMRDVNSVKCMTQVHIHLEDSTIYEYDAILLKSHPNFTHRNLNVQVKNKIMSYDDWRGVILKPFIQNHSSTK